MTYNFVVRGEVLYKRRRQKKRKMKQGGAPALSKEQDPGTSGKQGCERIHSPEVDSESYSAPGTAPETETSWGLKASLRFYCCRDFAMQNTGIKPLENK